MPHLHKAVVAAACTALIFGSDLAVGAKSSLYAKFSKENFIYFAIGSGGNVKQARLKAFEKLSRVLMGQFSTAPWSGASSASLSIVRTAFVPADFHYIDLGRQEDGRHVVAGIRPDDFSRLIDQISRDLDGKDWMKEGIGTVRLDRKRYDLAQNLISLSRRHSIPVPPQRLKKLEKQGKLLHNRMSRALVVFDGPKEDSIISVNHQVIDQQRTFLRPGRHIFRITTPEHHVIRGNIRLVAGEIRYLPITLLRNTGRKIPVQVVINKAIENFRIDIIEGLQLLNFSIQEQAALELSLRLNSDTDTSGDYGRYFYTLKLQLLHNRHAVASHEAEMELYFDSDEDVFPERSVSRFISRSLLAFTQQFNFDQFDAQQTPPSDVESIRIAD